MDPYTVLGVAPNASLDEIRQAYETMALKWHSNGPSDTTEESTDAFTQISFAYRTLIRDFHLPDASLASNRPLLSPPLPPSIHSVNSSNSIESPYNISTPNPSAISSQTTPSSSPRGRPVPLSTPPNQLYHQISNAKSSVPKDNVARKAHIGHINNTTIHPPPPPRRRQRARSGQSKQPTDAALKPQRNKTSMTTSIGPKPSRTMPTYEPGITYELLQQGPPLQLIGTGTSGEWTYSLRLTLEEFFHGKCCRFSIVRRFLSGNLSNVVVEVQIPPGCRSGGPIISGGIGHELPDGTFDDVSFILQELPHERFTRLHNDLLVEIQVPWTDDLRYQSKKVYIRGIDGEDIFVYVDYSRDKNFIGSMSVRGAGMPIRERGTLVGRGNLVVNWKIIPASTRMGSFIRRFFRRQV